MYNNYREGCESGREKGGRGEREGGARYSHSLKLETHHIGSIPNVVLVWEPGVMKVEVREAGSDTPGRTPRGMCPGIPPTDEGPRGWEWAGPAEGGGHI